MGRKHRIDLEKMLEDYGIMCQAWETTDEFFGFPLFHIEIIWGHWEYDHKRCDFIMEELGYGLTSEKETEADGSNYYSAIHNYVMPERLR